MAGVVTKRNGTQATTGKDTLLLGYTGGSGIDGIPLAGCFISYDSGETWSFDREFCSGMTENEEYLGFYPWCAMKDSNGEVLIAGTGSQRGYAIVYNYNQDKHYRFNYTYYSEEPAFYNGYGGVTDMYIGGQYASNIITSVEDSDYSLGKAPFFEYNPNTDGWDQSTTTFNNNIGYVGGVTRTGSYTILISGGTHPLYNNGGIFAVEYGGTQLRQAGSFYSLVEAGNGVLYAGEANGSNVGHVWKSTDNGITWTDLGLKGNVVNPGVENIVMLGNGRIGFSCYNNFYYTDDDFETCINSLSNMSATLTYKSNEFVCFTGVVASGNDVALAKSYDNGETWTTIPIMDGFQGVPTCMVKL